MRAKWIALVIVVAAFVAPGQVVAQRAKWADIPAEFMELREQSVQRVEKIPMDDFKKATAGNPSGEFLLIDVRPEASYKKGHLPGAVSMPRGLLELKIIRAGKDKSFPIYVYCLSGLWTPMAQDTLQQMGYTNVIGMQEGFMDWVKAGNTVER